MRSTSTVVIFRKFEQLICGKNLFKKSYKTSRHKPESCPCQSISGMWTLLKMPTSLEQNWVKCTECKLKSTRGDEMIVINISSIKQECGNHSAVFYIYSWTPRTFSGSTIRLVPFKKKKKKLVWNTAALMDVLEKKKKKKLHNFANFLIRTHLSGCTVSALLIKNNFWWGFSHLLGKKSNKTYKKRVNLVVYAESAALQRLCCTERVRHQADAIYRHAPISTVHTHRLLQLHYWR